MIELAGPGSYMVLDLPRPTLRRRRYPRPER
jgi:hypothetical protein